ncbi:probable methyltransferase PMT2 [Arachis duranensis]|uniref:Methyltransferase n=1 Tax=Arachis duranensis TaxID=130453 RepID=A0A6P4BF29_ARADU|nr:probable methyltransferase PMT2 [Arachis duranensis]
MDTCLVKPPVKEITQPIDLQLHSDVRAMDRAEFDHQVAEKLSLIEQYKLEKERQQKLEYLEERRIKDLVKKHSDMNAGLGSFAVAIQSPKLWVMNVVPTIAEKSTLGVIYERGLIGIYHDWCEAFSTYPRTYDLIHANGLFSLYKDK